MCECSEKTQASPHPSPRPQGPYTCLRSCPPPHPGPWATAGSSTSLPCRDGSKPGRVNSVTKKEAQMLHRSPRSGDS